MFIASKFEDVVPLRMRLVVEKIGHGKISIQTIRKCEMEMMTTI